MNNKKKLALLSLVLAAGMVFGACTPKTNPSGGSSTGPEASSISSSGDNTPSSSSEAPVTLVSITVTAPTKVAYTTDDTALDLAGMVVTANYSNQTTQVITTGYEVSRVDFSTAGQKTVTVTYQGKTDSFTINVTEAVKLVSITVTPPTKVNYTTADTALDLAGMVVTANFSNQTHQVVTTGYEVSRVDFSTPGSKTVTVTYQGKTDTFTVTVANQKFTVQFVVDGQVVQTGQVEKGQTASYTGETPTKAPDANAVRYRFKGWDKDIKQPITADTTFTAVFAAYAAEQVIDDFESYEGSSDMADAWKVEAYTTAWGDTQANVAVGSKATQGNKSLRFNAWENGTGFRFLKHNEVGAFSKAANAIKFNLQIPSINTVKVILKGKATIMGQVQEPSFTYEFHPTTNEYVEYTIPLAAAEWQLWGEAGKTISTAADMIGIHVDDVVNYITDVGFFVQGKNDNNLPFFAFVDNIRFVTIDEPASKSEVETMGQYTKYTGVLNNGYTVKVELGANGAATATVIDMETPQQIPGNVTIDANKNMTFTSADSGATLVYKAQLKNGGQSLKFVEAGGALASAVTGVDLNAVQVVDNYEQYTSDGQAYCVKYPDINARSGCRGAYYSEYYAGEGYTAPWGGNGWSLMGSSGEQLKLKQDQAGAHSGNNYLCLKHAKDKAMRYMQWGLFDGTAEQNNFRGSKFSFWAKTNGLVKQFKVAMYSQSKPTLQTKDSYCKVQTFEQAEAIGQWKHFEIDLNPDLTYYGFMITIEKNYNLSANEAFLYIDDVEVYTADPYKQYEAPVTQKELANGQVFFSPVFNNMASSTLVVGKNNTATISIPSSSTTIPATYTMEGNQVTFDLGAYGTYVAELDQAATKLTYVSATGAAATLGELSFDEVDVLDNAETYESSGQMYYQSNKDANNRSGARGAYYCDYYSGGSGSTVGGTGWSLMGGSGDQLSLSTDEHHSGSNSLKLKRNNGGNAMRYMTWGLMDGTAEGHTGAEYFIYFVKNPNAKAATIKTSVYYQAQVTASTQQSNRAYVEAQIPANSDWTPVVIPLDPAKTYYGVAYSISGVSQSAADYLYVDDAMFYSESNNITAPFLSIKNLKMDGALANGAAASITLGEGRNVTLSCAALGGDLACKFSLIGQTMTITAPAINGGSGTTIVGTYGASETEGYFQFVVTSCTGDMAAYLPANTVFQGPVA